MGIAKKIIEFVMDILETVVFIGSLFIVIYLFILTPNQVKGASMEPTFDSGDYILTSRVTYKLRMPQRGDVIVFKAPMNPDVEYIKRVIGLPGDQIRVHDGTVYVNNQPIQESYISAATNLWQDGYIKDNETLTVPDGDLWVMGDNRPRSSDSREFGPITISSIIGQVFFRYFPSNKMGVITNPLPAGIRS